VNFHQYVLYFPDEVSTAAPAAADAVTKTTQPASPPDEDDETDKSTHALVASSIPAYRNSDACPVAKCGRTMQFVQMHLVCSEHGFTDTRKR
jgi:hypothetical protein